MKGNKRCSILTECHIKNNLSIKNHRKPKPYWKNKRKLLHKMYNREKFSPWLTICTELIFKEVVKDTANNIKINNLVITILCSNDTIIITNNLVGLKEMLDTIIEHNKPNSRNSFKVDIKTNITSMAKRLRKIIHENYFLLHFIFLQFFYLKLLLMTKFMSRYINDKNIK